MSKSRKGNAAGRRHGLMQVALTLSVASATAAVAGIATFKSEGSVILEGEKNVAAQGGVFVTNAAVRVLQIGNKRLDVDEGQIREPVAVRVFSASAPGDPFVEISEATLESGSSPFEFAMTNDIEVVPGMTALDAVSSPDFGRMMRPEGTVPTRMQVFTPMPEKDDSDGPDDNPEVLIFASVPDVPVTITPILAGYADDPSSLVLGTPTEVRPNTLKMGETPLSMVLGSNPAPQKMCVIGFDLSSDLQVLAGQTIVGYQVDIPQGSSFPLKLLPVGEQQLTAMLMPEDGMTQEVGDVSLPPSEQTVLPGQPLDTPPLASETDYAANLQPFAETVDGAFDTPPIPPLPPPAPPPAPVPPVPTPGAAALVATAAAILGRRRRN